MTVYVDDVGYDPGYIPESYPTEVLRSTFESNDFSEWTSANENCFIASAGTLGFDITGSYCARLHGYRSMLWVEDEPEETYGFGFLRSTFTVIEATNFSVELYAKIGENTPALNVGILQPGQIAYDSLLVVNYHTDMMIRFSCSGYVNSAGEVTIGVYSSAPVTYGVNNSYIDQVVITLLSPYTGYSDISASGTTEYVDV